MEGHFVDFPLTAAAEEIFEVEFEVGLVFLELVLVDEDLDFVILLQVPDVLDDLVPVLLEIPVEVGVEAGPDVAVEEVVQHLHLLKVQLKVLWFVPATVHL